MSAHDETGIARCPFCNEPIQPSEIRNFAYVRTKFILHFETCPNRPAGLKREEEESLAERLYESITGGPD